MNKKIIVTGGAVFVGSNLIIYLLKNTNLKIISFDNYSSGQKNHIKNKRIKYIKTDTKDIFKTIKKPKEIKVINFGEFAEFIKAFANGKMYKFKFCWN